MEVGHTFTIEPMICMKSNKPVMWPDKWTAATSDGLQTAQFEHTLLITEQGTENSETTVLTKVFMGIVMTNVCEPPTNH